MAVLTPVRHARIKIPPEQGEAAYHCVTRTVNREHLFDDAAKEILRRQLWQVADYCGVKIVSYDILSNHFHVLVRVPQKQEISDAELLRRYRVMYPKPTRYQAARLEVIQAELARNGPEAAIWRSRQTVLMGDISQYMKLLKQRFSIWYNKAHQRIGTLWAERFKSVLVEAQKNVLQTMSAYIDLNSVRAGLTSDPKDYRFCSYAEAVAGNKCAQDGLASVFGDPNWDRVQEQYREMLFGSGAGPRDAAASIATADFQKVMAAGGKLPLHVVLRCRMRYFTDGAVLGRTAFVQMQIATYRQRHGLRRPTQPMSMPEWANLGDLVTLRRLRQRAIG